VLAVIGAGHKEGIAKHLAHPEAIPSTRSSRRNCKRITFIRVFGAAMD